MNYKTEIKTIAGKEYPYVLCPLCGVWIHAEDFDSETGKHASCERLQETKEIREGAERKALGGIR